MADRNPNITDQTGADIVNKLRAMYGNTEVYKPSHQGRNPMLSDATGKAIAEALGNVSEGGVGGSAMFVEFSIDKAAHTVSTTTPIADIVAAYKSGKAVYAHASDSESDDAGMNLYGPINVMNHVIPVGETTVNMNVVLAPLNLGEMDMWIIGMSGLPGLSASSSDDTWQLTSALPMMATSDTADSPSSFNAANMPISKLGAPTNATDAATKKYVDDSVGTKANKTDTVLETTLSRGRLGTAGTGSFAFGNNATASGQYSTATGTSTSASGKNTTAGGESSVASGDNSHAEGEKTKAQGKDSHAEGYSTSAQGKYSHAEGNSTVAQESAHAEGESSGASGTSSHAEGKSTSASGVGAHSEGIGTTAGAIASHAGGSYNTSMSLYPLWVKNTTYAVGDRVTRASSTAGLFLAYECITANSDPAFVNSKWKKLPSNTDKFFVIGNGVDTDNRSDAMTLDIFGNMELQGDLTLFKGKANEMLLSSLLGSSGGGDSVFIATVRPNQALRDATASPLAFFTAQSPTYSYEFVTPVSDIRAAIAAGKKIFIQGALDTTNGYSIIGSTATFMTNSEAPNLYVGYFQMIDFGYDMFKMYSAPNNYSYMPPTLMSVLVQMTQDGSVISGQTSDCALVVTWAYSLKNISA